MWRKGGWAAAGPLWREVVDDKEDGWGEEDGNRYTTISLARWLWWAERLDELTEGDMIDDESKALARASVETIRGLERQ